jgi:hypothetical protein
MSSKIHRRAVLKAGVATCTGTALGGVASPALGDSRPPDERTAQVPLPESSITHAGIVATRHPRLGVPVNAQTCVRTMRFAAPVRLEHLELGRNVYGRWIPSVPTHPAHLLVSVYDRDRRLWTTIQEVNLPPDPRIEGQDLSQAMSVKEMDSYLAQVLDEPPHRIELGGVETDHVRIVCDREHPVWPNHGECNGGILNVPFGTLNQLKAFGQTTATPRASAAYNPILNVTSFKPRAPEGMRVSDLPDMVRYDSRFLSVGFSLRRPLLMHLGWDALGEQEAGKNRLLVSRKSGTSTKMGGMSGPNLRTLVSDHAAHLWTGDVSVDGNQVAYRNLRALEGLVIDAVFTVEPERLTLALTQKCAESIPVLEAEAWRFAWDLKAGITGVAAVPTLAAGRNGDVHLPALIASDRVGSLSCQLLDSDLARLQVESYRFNNSVTAGFVIGAQAGPDACQVVPAGTHRATFQLAVTNLEPRGAEGAAKAGPGLRRHWATVFSCFRPEYRGFSNHSASVNCHLSQGPPIEIAAHTRAPDQGPKPLDLARFTLQKAFLDGGGYGYCRNLYLDSDPVLLAAAGRVHQAEPDRHWLRAIEPGLVETVERLLGHLGPEGLLLCRELSGNSGSFRWSSNSFDVVGFGHMDGYVNAWGYRALRNATALLQELPARDGLSQRCREAGGRLREAYAKALVNPETGWVAGWRSRDGALHDYAFTWVNGAAIAFGLLDPKSARKALDGLESLRDKVGAGSARMGIPCNLLPIRADDQMLSQILDGTQPTFEAYTDGSLSGWPATYYLRALSLYGCKDRARRMAEELDEGYAAGIFNGGDGSGHEFRSWEGLPTGYEGTLIGCFGPLYAIAIEQKVLKPSIPEWWPDNG